MKIFKLLKQKLLWRINHYKRKYILHYKRKYFSENSDNVLRWAVKSPRRSSFYYFFFSHKFDREHFGVLAGKLHHLGAVKSITAQDSTLRRNIHRLEKGLISIPLRDVFAQDYIVETIDAYEAVLKDMKELELIKWASDVLDEYFRSVEAVKNIKIAKERYQMLRTTYSKDKEIHRLKSIPYQRKDNVRSTINFEDFYKLSRQRRSVRWYEEKKVPYELIDQALSAAILSPSACNRQPYRFVFLDDPEDLKIAGFLPMGAKTFAHNIPMMAILVGDLTAYFDERDRHIIYIDGGLVSMSFMYALETLGLSSCPINWPDIEEREKKLAEFLNLAPYERCIMFMSIGYAREEGKIPFSQKRSLENIVIKKNVLVNQKISK